MDQQTCQVMTAPGLGSASSIIISPIRVQVDEVGKACYRFPGREAGPNGICGFLAPGGELPFESY
jgi:hypothetical protein